MTLVNMALHLLVLEFAVAGAKAHGRWKWRYTHRLVREFTVWQGLLSNTAAYLCDGVG